eukprot:870312-Pelagomonas_calceolata.AAC.2
MCVYLCDSFDAVDALHARAAGAWPTVLHRVRGAQHNGTLMFSWVCRCAAHCMRGHSWERGTKQTGIAHPNSDTS